jgi:hypothetical protein
LVPAAIGLAWSAVAAVLALGLSLARENVEPGELQQTKISLALAALAFVLMVGILVCLLVGGSPWAATASGLAHVVCVTVGLGLVWENGVVEIRTWFVLMAIAGELAVALAVAETWRRRPRQA